MYKKILFTKKKLFEQLFNKFVQIYSNQTSLPFSLIVSFALSLAGCQQFSALKNTITDIHLRQ